MPDLVGHDEPQLLVVEQVDQAGVEHDERVVGADRHGVRRGVLRDVQLRHLGQVEDVGGVADHVVDVAELRLTRAYAPAEEHQPDRALAEQTRQALEHGVEAGQRPQRDQRRPIRGMFVGAGADPGETRA